MTWFGWKNEQQLLSSPKPLSPKKTLQQLGLENSADDIENRLHKMLESPQSDVQSDMNQYRMAIFYFQNEKWDKSLEHLNNYLSSNSRSAKALKMKGQILEQKNDLKEALEFFIQAYEYGLNTPDLQSKIKRLICYIRDSNNLILKTNLDKYLSFAHKNSIELDTSLGQSKNLLDNSNFLDFSEIEAAIRNFKNSKSNENKLPMLNTLLSTLRGQPVLKAGLQTELIECFADSLLFCFVNLQQYYEKCLFIAEALESFLQSNFPSPDTLDDYQTSLYLLVFGLSLGVFENYSIKNPIEVSKRLSSVSLAILNISLQLFKSKYDLLSEELLIFLETINLNSNQNSAIVRIFSDQFCSLNSFAKAIGLSKPEKCFALKIIQQTLIVNQPPRDAHIKIHHSLNNLSLLNLIISLQCSETPIIHLLSETLKLQCQNNICPSSLDHKSPSLWDITLFMNFIRIASYIQFDGLKEYWNIITKAFISQTTLPESSMNFIRNLRSFSIDNLAKSFKISNFEMLENSLITEIHAFDVIIEQQTELYDYLLNLGFESKSNYVFHRFNSEVENIKRKALLNQQHNKSDISNTSIVKERDDAVTLKLIETFNNFMNIATIKSSHSSAPGYTSSQTQDITNAAESLASLSQPNPTSIFSSTLAIKEQPNTSTQKPINQNAIIPKTKPSILFQSQCSLLLERSRNRPHPGKIYIKKSSEMLTVQFLTENEKITKLKAIVKFKDQMPISPLLLQKVSQNKFNWTIIDFSSSDDGSLQNSAVEFPNERKLQMFIDTLTKAQSFDCVRENLTIVEESENESSSNDDNVSEKESEDQDVIFLGEYIPPSLTAEQRELCNELMLPLTFFEPCDGSSGEESSEDDQQSDEPLKLSTIQSFSNSEKLIPFKNSSNEIKAEQKNIFESKTQEKNNEKVEENPESVFKGFTLAQNNKTDKPTSSFADIFKSSPAANSQSDAQSKPSNIFNFAVKPSEPEKPKETASSSKPFSIFNQKSSESDSSKPVFSLFASKQPEPKESPAQENKSVFQFSRFTAQNSNTNDQNKEAQAPVQSKEANSSNKLPASQDEPQPPALIQNEKLEEPNARLVFHSKAKLYLFYPETNEWRGRGVGTLKVLIPDSLKDKNTAQIILRRNPFLQLSMNCLITADQEFIPVNDNQPDMTSFAVVDQSDNTPTERYFSVRFAKAEIMDKFRECLNDITSGKSVS